MDSNRGSERGSGLGGYPYLSHTTYTVKRGGAVGGWGWRERRIPDPNHSGDPIGVRDEHYRVCRELQIENSAR